MLAQDKLKVELKEAKKPHVYIDGKKYDYSIFDLLDQSKIESVNIIKDEEALEEYNAPNGVILIKTKSASEQPVSADEKGLHIKSSYKDPLVIIDGKVSNKATLSFLSPANIESINVLKGQLAIDLYKASNGVIMVKTKN